MPLSPTAAATATEGTMLIILVIRRRFQGTVPVDIQRFSGSAEILTHGPCAGRELTPFNEPLADNLPSQGCRDGRRLPAHHECERKEVCESCVTRGVSPASLTASRLENRISYLTLANAALDQSMRREEIPFLYAGYILCASTVVERG